MSASKVFDWVSRELASATAWSEIEARGTVRLALKEAGLEARDVTAAQMAVVLRQVLPEKLASRGIEGGAALCAGLAPRLPQEDGEAGETPERVFERLAG